MVLEERGVPTVGKMADWMRQTDIAIYSVGGNNVTFVYTSKSLN